MLNDSELRKIAASIGRSPWSTEQESFIEHGHYLMPKMANRRNMASLRPRHIDDARNFDRIQLNNQSHRNFLAVDVDGVGSTDEEMVEQAVERLLRHPVTPHVIVPTPHGAHGIWAIDSTVRGTRGDAFASDCQRNLSRAVGGDQHYGAHTVANPLCLWTGPIWLRDVREPYKLADIKGPLAQGWHSLPPWASGSGEPGDGRNGNLFSLARELACAGLTFEEAKPQLHEYNAVLPQPLPWNEVERTIRSAFKRRPGGNPYLLTLSRRGGSQNTEAQQRARSRNLEKANSARQNKAGERLEFILENWGLPNKALAAQLDVDQRTIRRHRTNAIRSGQAPV